MGHAVANGLCDANFVLVHPIKAIPNGHIFRPVGVTDKHLPADPFIAIRRQPFICCQCLHFLFDEKCMVSCGAQSLRFLHNVLL